MRFHEPAGMRFVLTVMGGRDVRQELHEESAGKTVEVIAIMPPGNVLGSAPYDGIPRDERFNRFPGWNPNYPVVRD